MSIWYLVEYGRMHGTIQGLAQLENQNTPIYSDGWEFKGKEAPMRFHHVPHHLYHICPNIFPWVARLRQRRLQESSYSWALLPLHAAWFKLGTTLEQSFFWMLSCEGSSQTDLVVKQLRLIWCQIIDDQSLEAVLFSARSWRQGAANVKCEYKLILALRSGVNFVLFVSCCYRPVAYLKPHEMKT